MLNWFSCRVSCAVGVISQSDRVVRRLFQRAQRVKGCHTASTLNCTHLILPILALTHTLHLSFIIILLLSLGDLTQCHSTYGKNSLLGKSDERKAKDVGKWIVMSLYTHFTWSPLWIPCCSFIFVSLLDSMEQIRLSAGGHPPWRHSFLITVQSSEKSYSHWGWTAAESCWGALFKQRRAVLPNLMETPSPAQPSAAHIFTWGYLLLKVRDRAAPRAGCKWVRGGHKNGKIRPLNEDEENNLICLVVSLVNWCVE